MDEIKIWNSNGDTIMRKSIYVYLNYFVYVLLGILERFISILISARILNDSLLFSKLQDTICGTCGGNCDGMSDW